MEVSTGEWVHRGRRGSIWWRRCDRPWLVRSAATHALRSILALGAGLTIFFGEAILSTYLRLFFPLS
jgi:uncharacterized membrane protein YedE/YeeE